MHAIIRNYSDQHAKALFDLLEKNKPELEKLMRPVTGFVSYTLLRTHEGGASVTVCHAKTGADESAKVARDWIAKNATGIKVGPPKVTEGTVMVHVS